MKEFFLGIIEITAGMSLLILVMLLGLKFIGGKFTAKCRYILWTLVMIRLAVPFSFGILPALIEVPVETEPKLVQVQMQTPAADHTPVPQNPVTMPPQEPVQMPSPPVQTPVFTEPEPEPITWDDVKAYIPHVWLIGAAVFLLWNLLSYWIYTAKILRTANEADAEIQEIYEAVCRKKGLTCPPKLLVSPAVNSPAAFGLICRRIVLPDIHFTENGLAGTLSHEVTHCKRGDLWIKAVCLLARTFHWYNPLVHLAAFRCEMEMELSCDESVLAGCDEITRAAYGEVMLDIIKRCRRNRGALTTHFNPRKNAVKARFTNILYGSGKRRGLWLIAVCLVLCLVAGAIVACRVEAEPVEEEEQDEPMTAETEETLPSLAIPHDQLLSTMEAIETDESYPAEDYRIEVTGMSVPVTLTMHLDNVIAVEAFGNRAELSEPRDIYGNCTFELFEAGGSIILEGGYYRICDIYILSDRGNHIIHPGNMASFYLWQDDDGALKYMYSHNLIAGIQQTGGLSVAVDYGEFLYSVGDAAITNGELSFSEPTEKYVISDKYDLDKEFREFYSASYNSIDEVFEENRIKRAVNQEEIIFGADEFPDDIILNTPAEAPGESEPVTAADPAQLYEAFITEKLTPFESYMVAMEYIDLDGNGIDELIVYDWGASANYGIEIFTVEDGEVRSFSTETNVITRYEGNAQALAPPSKNANDYVFWGVPTSHNNGFQPVQLWFVPCDFVNGHVLYSMNGSEFHTSEDYYYFTSDENGYLTVELLMSFYCEAIDSNPANGWNCKVNGEEVMVAWYDYMMVNFLQNIRISHGVRYHEKNTASRLEELQQWKEYDYTATVNPDEKYRYYTSENWIVQGSDDWIELKNLQNGTSSIYRYVIHGYAGEMIDFVPGSVLAKFNDSETMLALSYNMATRPGCMGCTIIDLTKEGYPIAVQQLLPDISDFMEIDVTGSIKEKYMPAIEAGDCSIGCRLEQDFGGINVYFDLTASGLTITGYYHCSSPHEAYRFDLIRAVTGEDAHALISRYDEARQARYWFEGNVYTRATAAEDGPKTFQGSWYFPLINEVFEALGITDLTTMEEYLSSVFTESMTEMLMARCGDETSSEFLHYLWADGKLWVVDAARGSDSFKVYPEYFVSEKTEDTMILTCRVYQLDYDPVPDELVPNPTPLEYRYEFVKSGSTWLCGSFPIIW